LLRFFRVSLNPEDLTATERGAHLAVLPKVAAEIQKVFIPTQDSE